MKAEFILAGCSVSSGVPAIGNDWGNCDPDEPKNRRDRPCAVVRTATTTVVIDTGPDFRKQMNDLDIGTLDAVFYTHSHSDHVLGIDELRVIRNRMGKLVDVYGNKQTIQTLQSNFDYMFMDKTHYRQALTPNIIRDGEFGKPIRIGDIEAVPFWQDHGDCDCVGYRFGNLGYSADMLDIGEAGIETLKGIDIWIADGAGYNFEKHKTHAPLSKIYKLNERIGASKVYVVGLSKFMDYQTLKNELPQGFEPSYDGLTLSVTF